MLVGAFDRSWNDEEARPVRPLLPLSFSTPDMARLGLQAPVTAPVGGVDLSCLQGDLDAALVEGLLGFCRAHVTGGALLRLSHADLGSGTDCEQRLYELKAERKVRESEKAHHERAKSESSKEKDFAVAAGKKRKAQAAIDVAAGRMAAIDDELLDLERRKEETPWYLLFSNIELQAANAICSLDLTDCGLHATAVDFLVQVMLDLEHRGEGRAVENLSLDSNDLGDIGMGAVAGMLRLSSAILSLQLQNVGISARGLSEVVAGVVANKSLAVLDLRSNNLCPPDAAQAAVSGVKRFNTQVRILLS